jgi:hypothetical protein
VEDPLFRDIKKGDFRLKEGSPAYKTGFRDIDVTRIGLTKDFPSEFMDLVKVQLGTDYDSFEKLEETCKLGNRGADKEFKEATGI